MQVQTSIEKLKNSQIDNNIIYLSRYKGGVQEGNIVELPVKAGSAC
jgi:hypothetical protein